MRFQIEVLITCFIFIYCLDQTHVPFQIQHRLVKEYKLPKS